MRYLFIAVLAILLGNSSVKAQADTSHYLLSDIDVQMEATDALSLMYNFKFAEANVGFNSILRKYPKHPLPYFLKGLAEFWKIKPNDDDMQFDKRFFSLMDSSIYFSEKMYDKNPKNMEARFFLSAAHGFKGRLESDRKDWTKSIFSAKNSLKYMPDKSETESDYSPEFLFGDGLSNYYRVWIAENYPILRPVISLFASGDKEVGIQQLTDVANNAFYTRVEAQTYLIDILAFSENRPLKALPYAKYLTETYPDNPYFERVYARLTYNLGQTKEAERVSLSILSKIDQKVPFYEATSGRYTAYILGCSQRSYGNREKAIEYFTRAVAYSEQMKVYESGYYLWSLTFLAQMYDEAKQTEQAKICYKKVKKYGNHDLDNYKQAKAWLEKH